VLRRRLAVLCSCAPGQVSWSSEADRQTASLAGLAVAVFLGVVGLFLVKELQAKSMIEDCLLSGQTQCLAAANTR